GGGSDSQKKRKQAPCRLRHNRSWPRSISLPLERKSADGPRATPSHQNCRKTASCPRSRNQAPSQLRCPGDYRFPHRLGLNGLPLLALRKLLIAFCDISIQPALLQPSETVRSLIVLGFTPMDLRAAYN